MTGVSFGLRTGSYGSLQQLSNGALQNHAAPVLLRKPSKLGLSGSREKEKFLPFVCRYLGRKRVAMMLLVALSLLVFVFGSFTVNKGSLLASFSEITTCIFDLSMNSNLFRVSSYSYYSMMRVQWVDSCSLPLVL